MRTGSTNSDVMMLVVPMAVSFGLIVVMSGGVEEFLSFADVAIREAATIAVTWLRSL